MCFLLEPARNRSKFFSSRLAETSRIAAFYFAFCGNFISSAKYLKKNIFADCRKTTDKTEHRAGARCEPCAPYRHSALYRIDGGHPQGHSQAMAGRRKPRSSRELSLSSRQSVLTDIAEINMNSPAIFLSWRALSHHELFIALLARYSRPSINRSHGISSGTIKQIPLARAAGLDDSIGWTSSQPHET